MPDRDAWWSVYLHEAWQNGGGPVHRLVDWASRVSPGDDIQVDVIDLAATSLAWTFSTSNRFLRDKATKALVALLTGRVAATVRMLRRFDDVDDPYVRERVYAVAYGVAMRSQDATEIEKLGRVVYENIFASGTPPTHIILRDYARGVVERALHLNENMAIDRKLLHPPYGSDWPRIPDDAEIDHLAPRWNEEVDDWGHREWARNSIRASVLGFGDFSRYVIGTNFNSSLSTRWLDVHLDEEIWQSPDSRLQDLLKNMDESERRAWKDFEGRELEISTQIMSALRFDDATSEITVPDEAETMLYERKRQIQTARGEVLAAMKEATRSELESIRKAEAEGFPGFDLSIVQRYVVWRVFDLGWTVERFGDFDGITIRDEARQADKAERMGKKYQWIAYHEILSHLADNYQYSPEFNGSGQVLRGAWQDSYRDIDPSSMLASKPGDTGSHGHRLSWWAQTAFEDWQEDESHQTWLDAESDFPQIEELLRAVRPDDATEWLNLEGSFHWEQPHSADTEPYDNPRRRIGILCQAYIIRSGDTNKFVKWARGVDFWGRWMPRPPDVLTSDMFLGEFAWSPVFRFYTDSIDSYYRNDGWSNAGGRCPVQVLPTSFHYLAESSTLDCSVDDGYSLYLPNATVIEAIGLKWTGVGADFIDKQGRLAAFDPTAHEDGANALLIREDVLSQFLAENDLALCWTVVGEKIIVSESHRNSQSLKFRKLTGAFLLTDDGIKRIHQESSYW